MAPKHAQNPTAGCSYTSSAPQQGNYKLAMAFVPIHPGDVFGKFGAVVGQITGACGGHESMGILFALPLLSAAAGPGVQIRPSTKHCNWVETTLVSWCTVVANPGSCKTPCMKRILKIVDLVEQTIRTLQVRQGVKSELQLNSFVSEKTFEGIFSGLYNAPDNVKVNTPDEISSFVDGLNMYRGGKGNDRSNLLSIHACAKLAMGTKENPERCLQSDGYLFNMVSTTQPNTYNQKINTQEGQSDGLAHRIQIGVFPCHRVSPEYCQVNVEKELTDHGIHRSIFSTWNEMHAKRGGIITKSDIHNNDDSMTDIPASLPETSVMGDDGLEERLSSPSFSSLEDPAGPETLLEQAYRVIKEKIPLIQASRTSGDMRTFLSPSEASFAQGALKMCCNLHLDSLAFATWSSFIMQINAIIEDMCQDDDREIYVTGLLTKLDSKVLTTSALFHIAEWTLHNPGVQQCAAKDENAKPRFPLEVPMRAVQMAINFCMWSTSSMLAMSNGYTESLKTIYPLMPLWLKEIMGNYLSIVQPTWSPPPLTTDFVAALKKADDAEEAYKSGYTSIQAWKAAVSNQQHMDEEVEEDMVGKASGGSSKGIVSHSGMAVDAFTAAAAFKRADELKLSYTHQHYGGKVAGEENSAYRVILADDDEAERSAAHAKKRQRIHDSLLTGAASVGQNAKQKLNIPEGKPPTHPPAVLINARPSSSAASRDSGTPPPQRLEESTKNLFLDMLNILLSKGVQNKTVISTLSSFGGLYVLPGDKWDPTLNLYTLPTNLVRESSILKNSAAVKALLPPNADTAKLLKVALLLATKGLSSVGMGALESTLKSMTGEQSLDLRAQATAVPTLFTNCYFIVNNQGSALKKSLSSNAVGEDGEAQDSGDQRGRLQSDEGLQDKLVSLVEVNAASTSLRQTPSITDTKVKLTCLKLSVPSDCAPSVLEEHYEAMSVSTAALRLIGGVKMFDPHLEVQYVKKVRGSTLGTTDVFAA